MLRLIQPVSNVPAGKPYRFLQTNIAVWSLEETLYHCQVFWKQSLDEFLSEGLIDWVQTELNLPEYAAKMRALVRLPSLSSRLCGFLTMADYYSEDDVADLRREIRDWEQRQEWEKLSEQGDVLMGQGEYGKAFAAYRQALERNPENARLAYNAGVALLHVRQYKKAAEYMLAASRLSPENNTIRSGLAEALHLSGAAKTNLPKFPETAPEKSDFAAHLEEAKNHKKHKRIREYRQELLAAVNGLAREYRDAEL